MFNFMVKISATKINTDVLLHYTLVRKLV
jgi:hypothetical protein